MLAALRCPVVPSPRRFVVPSSRRSVARRGARSFRVFRCFERVLLARELPLLRGARTVCVVPPYASVFRRACGRGSGSAAFRDCFDDRMSRMREGDSRVRTIRNRCGGYFQKPRGPRVSGGRISRKPEEKADAADPGSGACGSRCAARAAAPPGAEARNSLSLRAPSAGCGPTSPKPLCRSRRPLAGRGARSAGCAAAPDTEIPAAAQCTSFRAAGTDFPRKLSYLCRYL